MLSFSSAAISQITSYRNPNGPEHEWVQKTLRLPANSLKVAIAEVGYILIIPFAIIETAISLTAKLFSAGLPIGKENHQAMTEWVYSSAFSIAWAATDAVISPLCNDLIVTEKVARACAKSGNFYAVPLEAL